MALTLRPPTDVVYCHGCVSRIAWVGNEIVAGAQFGTITGRGYEAGSYWTQFLWEWPWAWLRQNDKSVWDQPESEDVSAEGQISLDNASEVR